jgi:hypothetical protein
MVWPPMLRRSCQTARMDDAAGREAAQPPHDKDRTADRAHGLADRLASSGADLIALGPALDAGEPWSLSAAYGTEPEADWGPREVLAHVNEMLPYWTAQLRRVAAVPDSTGPASFGRVASDADRIDRIARDRELPVGELMREIADGLAEARSFVGGLSDRQLDRVGLHPTRGEITVEASLDRFVVSHLGEHVAQLRRILNPAG